MTALRILFGLLFLVGFFFAAFAWLLVLTPIGIFQPERQYRSEDVFLSLTGCTLAITGYFLWASWLCFAVRGRFILRSEMATQFIAVANHLGWILFFPVFRGTNVLEFFSNLPLVAAWLVLNLIVGTGCLLYFWKSEHIALGEQADAPERR